MEFTYKAYRQLIESALRKGYRISDFHECESAELEIFLRHDIDTSLKKAEKIADLEAELGVSATYFLLLRTDFYNTASKSSQQNIRNIIRAGHRIGLHFDETAYDEGADLIDAIRSEAEILSEICEYPVKTVSMHRPSKHTLEADFQIPGIINTYGRRFFEEVKYVSDSRRCWREPVTEYIEQKRFTRIQILIHPFWYNNEESDIENSIRTFIADARYDRYLALSQNIRNFDEIICKEEVDGWKNR